MTNLSFGIRPATLRCVSTKGVMKPYLDFHHDRKQATHH